MMLASSFVFCILGLVVATPVELEKRMTIEQTPVLGWLGLPGTIVCIPNQIFGTIQVHDAASSHPGDCSMNNQDGFTYCKWALRPIQPTYSSYIVGRKRPGLKKVHFIKAQTDHLVWDRDGEGQHVTTVVRLFPFCLL